MVGLGNHDRGRLIMPCGTGKTFTSLRIAERIVADGGRVLFLAPSIALVSQARREWLRHTTRQLRSRVVCSDRTAGGRGENEDILSDYRVIVLGVHEDAVTPGIRQSLVSLSESQDEGGGKPMILREEDMTRVMGTSFAINGIVQGKEIDKPGPLLRTIAFANSIRRSRFFAAALKHPLVRGMTTRRLRHRDRMAEASRPLESQHLDASDSALKRNQALRRLRHATDEGTLRLLSNVKLFGEGVDVPALDAIVFMEPRDSQVDVVQAVRRSRTEEPPGSETARPTADSRLDRQPSRLL